MRTIRTFGAPAGAGVRAIVPGFESLNVRPISASVNRDSGLGNTLPGGACTHAAVTGIRADRSSASSVFMVRLRLGVVHERVRRHWAFTGFSGTPDRS